MCARSANAGGGAKTRVSFDTLVMDEADMKRTYSVFAVCEAAPRAARARVDFRAQT